jgi:hypothetical protein
MSIKCHWFITTIYYQLGKLLDLPILIARIIDEILCKIEDALHALVDLQSKRQHVHRFRVNVCVINLVMFDYWSVLNPTARSCNFSEIPNFSAQFIGRFASWNVRNCARPEEATVIVFSSLVRISAHLEQLTPWCYHIRGLFALFTRVLYWTQAWAGWNKSTYSSPLI